MVEYVCLSVFKCLYSSSIIPISVIILTIIKLLQSFKIIYLHFSVFFRSQHCDPYKWSYLIVIFIIYRCMCTILIESALELNSLPRA